MTGSAQSGDKPLRRPRERGDPYAAALRLGAVATGFCSNRLRWLWVPACAGTTHHMGRQPQLPRIQIFKQPRLQPHVRDLAAQSARVLLSMSRPPNSEGAGNAGRPMRPVAACAEVVVESTRVSQVTPESPGIPRAMVYGLLRALPGDRALLPPSPLRSLLLKNLTPASGRQDHTSSPSASGALVLKRHLRPPHPAPRP